MATCATCGNFILWGGVRQNGRRYCGKKCFSNDEYGRLADRIPDQVVKLAAKQIRNEPCPVCNRRGGEIEFRKSYKAISYLIMTSWGSYPIISCPPCHRKKVLGDFILTLLFGWWGFPWGIIMTPVQLFRNISAFSTDTNTSEPSQELCSAVRTMLAHNQMSLRSVNNPWPRGDAGVNPAQPRRDTKLNKGSPG